MLWKIEMVQVSCCWDFWMKKQYCFHLRSNMLVA